MEKIRLGRTEMMVSRLGFGGIPIQRVSEDQAVAVVKRCLDLGITFIDTANAYSNSEERIGKAIAGRREELILATKSTARTREDIEKHLELSLERLGVDYIDLFQFHSVSDFDTLEKILDPSGPRAVIEEAKKAGLVRHIGVSSHSMDVAKEAVKSDCFETIMFALNFLACEAADELLPLAREHDVGFIGMKSLAGGRLENATIAFKYLFQFPDVMPIPGIAKTAEIEEIVQVLTEQPQMTEADQNEMQRLIDELGTRFCRRCDYCQNCPQEIPISMVLSSDSLIKRLPAEQLFSERFAQMIATVSSCTECGECEGECPYNLPIIEMLSEQVEWYQEEKKKYQERVATQSG